MGSRFRHSLNAHQQTGPRPVPERNLLLAVLRRAMLDYRGNERELADAARTWFFESQGESFPPEFSFPWICEQLSIEEADVLDILDKPMSDAALSFEEAIN